MTTTSDNGVCERANDLVSFLYSELDDRTARDFEKHLRSCAICDSEFEAFGPVRESLTEWRNQSLGIVSSAASSPSELPRMARQRSALAAIRQFVELSPLWLRTATASAVILFCLLAAVALRGVLRKQSPLESTGAISQAQVENEIRQRVADELAAVAKTKQNQETVIDAGPDVERPKQLTGDRRPRRVVPVAVPAPARLDKPLTRAEREQLAADLRLTSRSDDDDLELLSDKINR